MAYGVGAGGIMGIAPETTSGTYLAPLIYVPFNSESLTYQQETNFRRSIRNSPDVTYAVPGNAHTEGDIQLDATADIVAYFMQASRMDVVKTGVGPYVYTGTPNALATPAKTLSITIVRDGICFAYTGCVVSQFAFGIDSGTMTYNVSIVGADEGVQSVPTPTWPTSTPFGMGQYSVEIPTATPVTDADTFEFTVNDNAEPQYRLKSTGRGANFVKFGEREVTLTVERDFQTRVDYDAFKAMTAQTLTISATKTAAELISILAPVSIKDTYEVALSGQGDLVRASIAYQCLVGPSTAAYTLISKNAVNIV
jgi:YD repeat-containing protein